MAVTQRKKPGLPTVPDIMSIQRPVSVDSAFAAARNRKQISERSILTNSRPRGFARPTKASKLKRVTPPPPPPPPLRPHIDVPEQEVIEEGVKSERIVLLKNLAKLLVDRIEAACAARQPSSTQPHLSTPEETSNLDTLPPCLLPQKLNGNSAPDPGVFDPTLSLQVTNANLEAEYAFLPREKGSNLDLGSCREEKARFLIPLAGEEIGNDGGESRPCSRETNIVSQNDSRPCTRERIDILGSGFCPRSRETNGNHGSESQLSMREKTATQGRNSRPPSQAQFANVGLQNPRLLSLKKVNVGVDNYAIPPKSTSFVHDAFLSPRGKKRSSPGLRSLVVPQVKAANVAGPNQLPLAPANTALPRSSAKHMQAAATGEETLIPVVEEKKGLDEAGHLKSDRGQAVYEAIWAELVRDIFDEVLGAQAGPRCIGKKNRMQSPMMGSRQLMEATKAAVPSHAQAPILRAAEERRSLTNGSPHVKMDSRVTPPPGGGFPCGEQRSPSPCSGSPEGNVGSRAPVILPTVAKYHMDMIERYKKCLAQSRLTTEAPQLQNEHRPCTAPDSLNVFNVYTQRCASQAMSRESEPVPDWQMWKRGEVGEVDVSERPTTAAASAAGGTRDRRRRRGWNLEHDPLGCRVESAGSASKEELLLQGCKLEVRMRQEKFTNWHQEPPGDAGSKEKRAAEMQEATTRRFQQSSSGGDGAVDMGASHSSQRAPVSRAAAATPLQVGSSTTKESNAADQWAFLDHQIEVFIHAHILQCCILFRNVPQFLQF